MPHLRTTAFMPDFGRDTPAGRRITAPDIIKDPMLRFLHYFFLPLHILLAAPCWPRAGWAGIFTPAMSFLLWGMSVRLIYVLHVTWFVNSASHIWGYRNDETTDNSRNCWWVGLLAFGEGWHNNHYCPSRPAQVGNPAMAWPLPSPEGLIGEMLKPPREDAFARVSAYRLGADGGGQAICTTMMPG